MKYFYTLFLALMLPFFAVAQQTITYSVSPVSFDETDAITITFNVNETAFGVASSKDLYLWAWSIDSNAVLLNSPTNGTWPASNPVNKLTYVSSAGGIGT